MAQQASSNGQASRGIIVSGSPVVRSVQGCQHSKAEVAAACHEHWYEDEDRSGKSCPTEGPGISGAGTSNAAAIPAVFTAAETGGNEAAASNSQQLGRCAADAAGRSPAAAALRCAVCSRTPSGQHE